MKVKIDKIQTPSLVSSSEDQYQVSSVDAATVERNQSQMRSYISTARAHLESLKQELYKTLDASGLSPAILQANGSLPAGADTSLPLSAFLEKAYTVQTYSDEGEPIINREQPYIDTGKQFAKFCDEWHPPRVPLTTDQILLNDAGKMIASINTALSQLNKVEATLTIARKDPAEYERAGLQFQQIPNAITTVLDSASQSKFVEVVPNQTVLQKIWSGLSELASKIGSFFSNLGKSETQQYREKFSAIREKYEEPIPSAAEEHHVDVSNDAKPAL
ncbi:hypothetical protein [Legionella oakridgensis]|uniref:Uncharacterized protein n=2 Tax=Legionella oakridgensis TaxID=29423 RepID=W0BF97_9GAMM|nr:hypothetical protein [Legionella oakridgensis]AHE67272.1 hypothetical protein Loa_01725 [Legionella oakridgensis ATCC 33761 = DSM 21215]KTD37939.1 hypothetical protein Loak_1615 [Legionella oakridgensis]STY20340.1 Uncharacterised protein [Legionella longbeachae]